LSLLAILPDGVSDAELNIGLPITNILACRTALLQTSLAYVDTKRRLKSLVPIREYVGHAFPPSQPLVQRLFDHFHELLKFRKRYTTLGLGPNTVETIAVNRGNIRNLLFLGLKGENLDIRDVIQCLTAFNGFLRLGNYGPTDLLKHISVSSDREMDSRIILERFLSWRDHPIAEPEALLARVADNLLHFKDPIWEGACLINCTYCVI
jgi:hypothetical protein